MTKVSTNKTAEKQAVKNRLSYGLGGIGRDMAYKLYNSQILLFIMLTRSITVQMLTVLGVIMMVCKVFDAFNDPVMGMIVENTRTKYGKFKPWIIIGVITNSLVLISIFSSPLQGWNFIILFGFMYLMWDITYTMNDIGYWSMLPSLSNDSQERNKNTSFANLCSAIGGGVTLALAPMLTVGNLSITDNVSANYSILTVIVCVFFIGCQLLTVFGVKEQVVQLPPKDKKKRDNGLKKLFNALKKNDQLRWVAVALLAYNLAASIISGLMTMYIYIQFKYDGGPAGIFSVLFGLTGALPMIIYPMLSKKLSRKKMFALAAVSAVFGYICFFLTGILWAMSFVVLAVWGIFISFGQSLFNNILIISIANTVEYNEWKTGNRDEGILFSLKPLMSKFADALEIGITTAIFAILGINEITNKISDYENAAKMGEITKVEKNNLIEDMLDGIRAGNTTTILRALMVAIPIILIVFAFIISRKKFTIDENKYALMVKEIAERNGSNGSCVEENGIAKEIISQKEVTE